MAEVKYKIASNAPTRKWKASAASGATVGGAVGVLLSYAIARVDPAMPPEVLAATIWLTTWGLTQASMMAAGWLARPSGDDAPVVDPASVPPRARRIPPD